MKKKLKWGQGISALLAVLIVGGCQNMVAVTHGNLKPAVKPANLTIQIDKLAVNARKERPNLIGMHLFTVFGIPVADINVERPLPELIHPFIVESLEAAGYSVVDVREKKVANVPVLRGEIRNFWFAGYSWLWPLYIQGGNMKYCLILQRPDGTVLYEKELSGGSMGVSVLADIGYDALVKSAVTKVLKQIIGEVQSEEFKAALRKR